MGKTHKDRHKWKRKERKKTGQSDPKKIKLHRKRFLGRLEQRTMIQSGGYKPIVFKARLKFLVEEGTTELSVHGEKVVDIPFLVDDPTSCHYAVAAHTRDFNATHEADTLSKHVQRMKYLGQPCHLMVQAGEAKVCSSIATCSYRHWIAEQGMPECTLK